MVLFLLIVIVSVITQLLLPWWSMLLVAIMMSFFAGKSFRHAISGAFLACGSVWLVYALLINFNNGHLMTDRIAELFSLPAPWLLYPVSFLLAALGGAIGAWCGFALKKITL